MEVQVDAGELVLAAGTENSAAYLVVKGQLEVRLVDADAAPIVIVNAGDCVGEMSILSRLKVSACVVATQASQLLVVPDEVLWSLVASSHEFSANLLAMLSGRLHEDNVRLLHSLDAQHRYERAAKIDTVTGLYNRRWFDEILERQWRRARAEQMPLSAIFVDLDHFKLINDQYGHLAGDLTLRSLGNLLQSSIRPMDLAARFGGEEFALLLYGVTLNEAREVSERLRRDIADSVFHHNSDAIQVTASLGVAELKATETASDLLRACDEAMYRAKSDGRNRVCVRTAAATTGIDREAGKNAA